MVFTVAALYHFVSLDNLEQHKKLVFDFMNDRDMCGTLLIAPEGINGTLAGSKQAISEFVELCHNHFGIPIEDIKYSTAQDKPFNRLKVRIKKETITLRCPEADPSKQVGQYVQPEDWDTLVNQDDVILLDTRNIYETEYGIFKGAVDPRIENFTEFKDYVREHLADQKDKKVAMYCTGGIRCEKASSFMLHEGFKEVYHLKGGILKYLETIPQEKSSWEGSCYVFDSRIAVGHGLVETEKDD